jgi:hypothetical protein
MNEKIPGPRACRSMTVSKKKPIPQSKATNAYDLLGDVITAIKEEPKRVYMEDWIKRGRQLNLMLKAEGLEKEDGPACGTVGCIAGWTTLLAARKPRASSVHGVAQRLLGAIDEYGSIRNYALYVATYTLFTTNFPDAKYGTEKYAQHVIRNIREFRKAWQKELLATPIPKRKAVKRVRVSS